MQGPALYHQLVIHNGTVYLAGQTAASLAHDKSGDTYAGQAAQVLATYMFCLRITAWATKPGLFPN